MSICDEFIVSAFDIAHFVPGSLIYIFDVNLKDLKDNYFSERGALTQYLKAYKPKGIKINICENNIRFKNGSKIQFQRYSTEQDIMNICGACITASFVHNYHLLEQDYKNWLKVRKRIGEVVIAKNNKYYNKLPHIFFVGTANLKYYEKDK